MVNTFTTFVIAVSICVMSACAMQNERVYKCLGPTLIQYSQGPLYVSKMISVNEHGTTKPLYFVLRADLGIAYTCTRLRPYHLYNNLEALYEQQKIE